jgi:hypothetical protein
MAYRPYASLYARLVANTSEPANDQACWPWTATRDRWGYGRLNIYVPGLQRHVKVQAHIALWVWLEARCTSTDDLWLAYQELQASGLELDHTCEAEGCVNPDHTEPVTGKVNCQRRDARARLRVSTYS